MQYQGLMFSEQQRTTILDFQEQLGVDICQAGYPVAHPEETRIITALARHVKDNQYQIRIAAMGRAMIKDATAVLDTGSKDLHLHLRITPGLAPDALNRELESLVPTVQFIRNTEPEACICLIMLDIGRSDFATLELSTAFCSSQNIDMISLPDTSGIMMPDQVFETLNKLSSLSKNLKISVHCHNDMGMAAANSYMGVTAGGAVLEASVLGIGERNGIADLYTTAKALKDKGIDMGLKISDIPTFKAYYHYVDDIVKDQLGFNLLNSNTPFFGDAVKTHVAGTHAGGEYGMAVDEKFYLNGLCGRHLVKKYLGSHHINCPDEKLGELTREIKSESYRTNRRLTPSDIKKIIVLLADSG